MKIQVYLFLHSKNYFKGIKVSALKYHYLNSFSAFASLRKWCLLGFWNPMVYDEDKQYNILNSVLETKINSLSWPLRE